MPEMKKRYIRLLTATGCILLIGVVLYVLAKLNCRFPCIFYTITKLQCPGCGSTRAVMALLRFDIRAAFGYNLMFPVCFLFLGYVYVCSCVNVLKTGKFSYEPPVPAIDVILLVVLVLWGVVRNILHI